MKDIYISGFADEMNQHIMSTRQVSWDEACFFIRLHAVIFSMHQAIICTALLLTAFFLFMSKKEACMYKQKTKALMQKLMSLF